MARRQTLTDAGVAALKPRGKRYYLVHDPELRGHYVKVEPTGTKTFLTVTRNPSGKQIWKKLGPANGADFALSIEEARGQARTMLAQTRRSAPVTLDDVAQQWL